MGAATHTPDPSGGAPLLRPDACIACPVLHRSHVILPKHVSKNAPKGRLLSESEWRGLGVQQSRGWVHYAIHRYARPRTCRHSHDANRRLGSLPCKPCLGQLCVSRSRCGGSHLASIACSLLFAALAFSSSQPGAAHPALPPAAGHGPDHRPRARQAHRPVHWQDRWLKSWPLSTAGAAARGIWPPPAAHCLRAAEVRVCKRRAPGSRGSRATRIVCAGCGTWCW